MSLRWVRWSCERIRWFGFRWFDWNDGWCMMMRTQKRIANQSNSAIQWPSPTTIYSSGNCATLCVYVVFLFFCWKNTNTRLSAHFHIMSSACHPSITKKNTHSQLDVGQRVWMCTHNIYKHTHVTARITALLARALCGVCMLFVCLKNGWNVSDSRLAGRLLLSGWWCAKKVHKAYKKYRHNHHIEMTAIVFLCVCGKRRNPSSNNTVITF